MTRGPVIGVTGLPCAGKSHVAGILVSNGVAGAPCVSVHADRLGHEALRLPEVATAVINRFGKAVADGGGRIVRARVAEIVFADSAQLAWLESVLHPIVAAEAGAAIVGAGCDRAVALEAALLFEAGMDRLCDFVLVVEASRSTRLGRAAARGWDESEMDRREKRLLPLFTEARLAACPAGVAVIDNNANNAADGSLAGKIAEALSTAVKRKDKS